VTTGSVPIDAQPEVLTGEVSALRPQRGAVGRTLLLVRRKPLGAISLVVIAILVFTAIFAPLIATYDPTLTHPRERLQDASAKYLLGTDNLGRDTFSRIVYGARTSLVAGVTATIFGTILGSLIGMASGYAGGRVDYAIQRVMDALLALPLLVLLIVIVGALGPSLWNIIWALSIGILPAAGRIIRGSSLTVKTETYIEAARVVGARPLRILFRHMLPNVTSYIIIVSSVTIGGAILAEAGLSFLGLGVPPPTPSWGGMLTNAGRLYFEQQPRLAIYPGLAITITVLAFNLLGDTLRDILDPRLRGTR
jgi:ABC-type dipeptide/oligopeptide/nickel transport system permease subunit